jgi:hypothetical protein
VDGKRFDAIARGVFSQVTRRRTLGGLAGGALVTLGLARPEDAYTAKSRKCKGGCDLCERCDKGSCRRNNKGRKVCTPGNCEPTPGEICTTTEGGLTFTATCQADNRCCLPTGSPCVTLCPNPSLPCPACCNTFCRSLAQGGTCS